MESPWRDWHVCSFPWCAEYARQAASHCICAAERLERQYSWYCRLGCSSGKSIVVATLLKFLLIRSHSWPTRQSRTRSRESWSSSAPVQDCVTMLSGISPFLWLLEVLAHGHGMPGSTEELEDFGHDLREDGNKTVRVLRNRTGQQISPTQLLSSKELVVHLQDCQGGIKVRPRRKMSQT